MPRIEPSIAALAKSYLEEDGIQFLQGVHTQEIKDGQNSLTVVTDKGDFEFDILLYATGRKPNTAGLGLETQTSKSLIVERFKSTVIWNQRPGVFAVGDVNGGPQFTYMSLDDFRIVFNSSRGMVATISKHAETMRQHSSLLLHWPKSA